MQSLKINKNIAPLLLFLISIASLVTTYFQHKINLDVIFNADNLYFTFLVKSVLFGNAHYNSWYVSTGLYLFPDAFFFLISMLFTNNNAYFATPLFMVLQAFLIYYAINKFTDFFVNSYNAKLVACCITVSFISLAIVPESHIYPFYLLHFLCYGMHTGIVILTFLILSFFLKTLDNKQLHPRYLILAFILSTLTVSSDSMIIAWCLIPLSCTLFLLRFTNKISNRLFFSWLFIIISSLTLGYLLRILLTPKATNFHPYLSLYQIPENYKLLKALFSRVIPIYKLLTLFSIALSVILTFIFIPMIWQSKKQNDNLYAILCFNSCLFIFLIFSIFTIVGDGMSLRFIFILYILPIVTFLIFLASNIKNDKIFQNILYIMIIAANLLTIFKIFSPWEPFQINYIPRNFSCIYNTLKKYHVTHGISGYWDAKPLIEYSKNKDVTLAAYIKSMQPFYWITNSRWFRDEYDFAIYHKIKILPETPIFDKAFLINIAGQPKHKVICGNYHIFIYGKNKLIVSYQTRLNKHENVIFKPKILRSAVGTLINGKLVARNHHTKAGFMTYGPYIKLSKGRYRISIIYQANQLNNKALPWFDVTYALGKIELAHKKLPITGSNFKSISAVVKIEKDHLTNIEFRTFYNGQGNLKIDKITLKKLHSQ
jgi:hypothetical protein